jgi:RNA polymerase sigma-70 factor (ECF subfamily)
MTARRIEELADLADPAYGSYEDKDLTLAFQNGEQGAYEAIYDRFDARVHGVCRRMLADRGDAEEAVQETFLRVYQALGRFNGRYQLGAWIARIATNVCLDHLRAKSRRPSAVTPLEIMDLDPSGHTEDSDPEHLVIRNAEGRRVRRVLASLSPMHRAAIVLRDFEGLSYEEIAVALDTSETRVKALLHRARKSFKRSWHPLAALLPVRWAHRARALLSREEGAGLAPQVSSSATQLASSCTTALQYCGVVATERFASGTMAFVIGTAALAATPAVVSKPASPEKIVSVSVTEPTVLSARAHSEPRRAPVKESVAPVAPAPVPAPAEEQPADEPEPAPAEDDPAESAEESSSDPKPTPSPTPSPTATPSPPPFQPAIGFDRYGAPAGALPMANTATVTCWRRVVEQHLETTIYDGARSFPGTLDVRATSTTGRVELTVQSESDSYSYSSWGKEPVATWTASPDGYFLTLELIGEYGPLRNEEPDDAGLPKTGTFRALLKLDCRGATVITEEVAFSSQ